MLTRRLWANLTVAIKNADMNAAQVAKSTVEDRQRTLRQLRADSGAPAPTSRFFVPVGEKWMPKLDVDKLPKNVDELESAVRNFIFGDKVPGPPPAGSEPSGSAPAMSIEVPPVGASSSGGAAASSAGAAAPVGAGVRTAAPAASAPGSGAGVAAPVAAGVGAGVAAGAGTAAIVGTGGPMPAAANTGVPMGAEVISGVPAGSQVSGDNRRTSVASSISDDEFHDAQEEHY